MTVADISKFPQGNALRFTLHMCAYGLAAMSKQYGYVTIQLDRWQMTYQ